MRNYGKAWIVLGLALIVLLLLGIGIFSWYIGGYNRAVDLEQGAEKAWADIDAALHRGSIWSQILLKQSKDMQGMKKS